MKFDLQTGYLRVIKIKKNVFIYLFRLNLTQFIPENKKKTHTAFQIHTALKLC